MRLERGWPAPLLGRRSFLRLGVAALAGGLPQRGAAEPRRRRIAFANLSEDPADRLEGLGFTGADVRQSFVFAARELPVDLVFLDNDRNREKAIANAAAAIEQRVELYIQYCADAAANEEVAKRLAAARIPVIAVNDPVPGAPLYAADNLAAGRIAGEALARFAQRSWRGLDLAAAIVGDLGDAPHHVPERADGVAAALKEGAPAAAVTRIDAAGNPGKAEGLVRRFAAGVPSGTKILVAALDDATALAAKSALEATGRSVDAAIASQGCDRSVHGGLSERKEIDPNNRGSILLGSVAYFLDRYGYEILPLALKLLDGAALPPRTPTRHLLVTSANVFQLYPPTDMN